VAGHVAVSPGAERALVITSEPIGVADWRPAPEVAVVGYDG
jgi:hypothetical protein